MKRFSAAEAAATLLAACGPESKKGSHDLGDNRTNRMTSSDERSPSNLSEFQIDLELLEQYGIFGIHDPEAASEVVQTIIRDDLPDTDDRVSFVSILREHEQFSPLHIVLRNWIGRIPADKPVPTDLAIRGAESFREQGYPSEAVTLINRALRWKDHDDHFQGILHTQKAASLLDIFEIAGAYQARADAWKSIKAARQFGDTPHLTRVKRRYKSLFYKRRRRPS